MKKIFTAIAALAIIAATSSSCNKCYVCDCSGTQSPEYCSKNFSKSQLDALESTCESGGSGCSWNVK